MQAQSTQQENDFEQKNKGTKGKNNESVDTMLEFNALQYNMWPDLTVCVDRTMKNSFFQTNSYTNTARTGYCILNTGSDFILGRTSYLVFDLEVGIPEELKHCTPLWGAAGSAYNMIRRLTITDRSGNELERIVNVNKLVNIQIRHTQSEKFLTSVGSCFLNPAEIKKENAITSNYPVRESKTWFSVDDVKSAPIATYNLAYNSSTKKTIQPNLGRGTLNYNWDNASDAGNGMWLNNGDFEDKTNQTILAIPGLTYAAVDNKPYDTLSIVNNAIILPKMFPLGTKLCYSRIVNEGMQSLQGRIMTVLGHNLEAGYLMVTKISIANIDYAVNNRVSVLHSENSSRGYVINKNNHKEFSVSGRRWCLPLRFMSGLFDYDQLLPMQVISGLRIEIEWATPAEAFRWAGADQTADFSKVTYEIKNPRIVTDSCKMTDAILQELNSRSANNGLEIVYRTFFTTQHVKKNNEQQINIESRKAVSRCFGAYAAFYRNWGMTSDQHIRDQMETLSINASEWQWRAGNLYFPNQMMKCHVNGSVAQKSKSIAAETYMHVMRMFFKLKHTFEESYINVNNYTTALPGPGPKGLKHYVPTTFTEAGSAQQRGEDVTLTETIPAVQCCLYPLDLERSTVQDLSGLPLNNSRVLNFSWRRIPEVETLLDVGPNSSAIPFQMNGSADSPEAAAALYNVGVGGGKDSWIQPSNGLAQDSYSVNLFMQYLKVARVFIDNVQIEE